MRRLQLAILAIVLASTPWVIPASGTANDPTAPALEDPGEAGWADVRTTIETEFDDHDRKLAMLGATPRTGPQPVDHALDMVEATSGPADGELGSALERAQAASAFQASVLGLETTEPEPFEDADRPSEAIRALHTANGGPMSAEQTEQARAVDRLSSPQAQSLANLVDAFRAFQKATRTAHANEAFALDRGASPTDPFANVDESLAPVLETRSQLLEAIRELDTAFDGAPTTSNSADVDQCPVLAVDLGGDDEYTGDCSLIVDLGGDDTYHNNAGGAFQGAAAVVDIGGNDTYGNPADLRSDGVNGGAIQGAGILVDATGHDVYNARSWGVNGGAFQGLGLLVDATGHDDYNAGHDQVIQRSENGAVGSYGVNGGGHRGGLGLLVDGAGDDDYRAGTQIECQAICSHVGSLGVNGGSNYAAIGVLLDGEGQDDYKAATNLDCPTICDEVALKGVNGGSHFGVAALVDSAGEDTYQAGVHVDCRDKECRQVAEAGVNGGGLTHATGVLVDRGEGADTYEAAVHVFCDPRCHAGREGVNGGSAAATGLMVDTGGNDTYRVGHDVEMTCVDSSCDLNVGSDAVNGGGDNGGRSLLFDVRGDDRYEAGTDVVCPSPKCGIGDESVNGGGETGVGMLLDGEGTDEYIDQMGGAGTDKTVAPKGTVGAQIDSDDPLGVGP